MSWCPPAFLASLCNYCAHRQEWFDAIIDFHGVGQGGHQLPLNITAKEVAKALPLRLLHGGNYLGWVREFGVQSRGVEHGQGLGRVVLLARQLKLARKVTVAAFAREHPAWVEAALEKARQKKAKGPLATMPQWQRAIV